MKNKEWVEYAINGARTTSDSTFATTLGCYASRNDTSFKNPFNAESEKSLHDEFNKSKAWWDNHTLEFVSRARSYFATQPALEDSKPPVDTIAVPREVLMGVREALTGAIAELNDCAIELQGEEYNNPKFNKALASLDAVLSEGE